VAKYSIANRELKKMSNTYDEYVEPLIEGIFVNSDSNNINDTTPDDIQEWLIDPEKYYKEMIEYMKYMYISDGSIYQMNTLFEVLPKLNYKIKTFDASNDNFKNKIISCEKLLHQVKYKTLTRDIINQLCLTGTVICIWLGSKKTPYLYVFDNNQYIFSPYRVNGEWVVRIDLAWLEQMKDEERERMYETFKDIKLEAEYKKFQTDSEGNRYLTLPTEKTCVLKINTILRNQRIGLPMGIQSLFDSKHKERIRELEKNIIDKIVKSIAVLTIGDDKHEYHTIGKKMKEQIIANVVNSIKRAQTSSGLPTTVLPPYAKLTFPDIKGLDIFKEGAHKYDEIDNAIQSDLGINKTLVGGNGSNYQSAKLSLDILHSRIGVVLEEIQQVFQKLFLFSLGKKVSEDYIFEFVTGTPLTNKEELEILSKLHTEGTSYKNIIDMLSTVTYTELLDDSIREIDNMGLRDTLIPPKSSYTMSSSDNESGRESIDEPENEETIRSQETGGNLIDGSID